MRAAALQPAGASRTDSTKSSLYCSIKSTASIAALVAPGTMPHGSCERSMRGAVMELSDEGLQRFIEAQGPVYESVCKELAAGCKTSH